MSKLTLSWQENNQERLTIIDPERTTNKTQGSICLGRDPQVCDVILNDPRISRLHARIIFAPNERKFYLENLKESNPIFVDGKELVGGLAVLKNGSAITLGKTIIRIGTDAEDSDSQVKADFAFSESSVTFSQIIPLASTGKDLGQNASLFPGILTVIWVILLFANLGKPNLFNFLLAIYLGGSGFFFIYRLFGKKKPWWILGIPILATPLILLTPLWSLFVLVFREILPGRVSPQSSDFLSTFIGFFFGAGLAEELIKALPIFGVSWYTQWLRSPQREYIGVSEPLDGIILGAASGLGFTLLETLGQYVPDTIHNYSTQVGAESAELLGLQLLIPRIVGSVFGHMAYSGYFGYYIGLSQLKPRRRWRLLWTGYLISSATHALWNSSLILGIWALGLAGILAYCMLTGAVLKAQQLSPSRSKN